MEFSTHLGATSLRLKTVICLYETQSSIARTDDTVPRQIASIHEVIETKTAPVLGPGRPASLSGIRCFKEGLGQSQGAAYLPPHILAYSPASMLWHVPAAPRHLFWKTKNEALNAVSGQAVPCPPLIFRAEGETPRRMTLSVWAYRPGDAPQGRPVPSTLLYNAPFFNVNSAGRVCLGSMNRPDSHSPEAASVWQASFFESRFTHGNGSVLLDGLPTYADTIVDLAEAQRAHEQGKREQGEHEQGEPERGERSSEPPSFPLGRLVPAERTLADVIG